jgi:hypothetical protein
MENQIESLKKLPHERPTYVPKQRASLYTPR